MTAVPVKLGNTDEGRGESAKRVRQRSTLWHRRHRHPHAHRESNERADREARKYPRVSDDLVMHQRADDGHQHAKLGEMHSALRGFGMAQSFQSENEKD